MTPTLNFSSIFNPSIETENEWREKRLEQKIGMIAENGIFQIKQELEWFSVEDIRNEIAIPSAFSVFTKYMDHIKENKAL